MEWLLEDEELKMTLNFLTRKQHNPFHFCCICQLKDEPVPGLLKKDNKRKSNWDDEDLDDNDVKDSWEEEDEPAPAPKTESMPTEKAPKKTAAKTVEKKQKRRL
ncbi:hypothetical protein CASFOL_031591 [Castilleja foliolosa]|uniref:Uncharacterized protein n=1 Tax=Castilleja foliolosa TaxID=1961234 RepID=A0ABD3C559_9LAMI